MKQLIKEVRNAIKIHEGVGYTGVVALAVAKDPHRNDVVRIPLKKGLPLGGYVYNTVTDSYSVNCAEFINLGRVNVTFTQVIEDAEWQMHMPIPTSVLERYFSSQQANDLRLFRQAFQDSEYDIRFLQMIET
jgi:hypothetical protein